MHLCDEVMALFYTHVHPYPFTICYLLIHNRYYWNAQDYFLFIPLCPATRRAIPRYADIRSTHGLHPTLFNLKGASFLVLVSWQKPRDIPVLVAFFVPSRFHTQCVHSQISNALSLPRLLMAVRVFGPLNSEVRPCGMRCTLTLRYSGQCASCASMLLT